MNFEPSRKLITHFLIIFASLLVSRSFVMSQSVGSEKLRNEFVRIAETAQGKVGVAATILETGEAVNLAGEQHYPMQSVYKLPIAMTVLHLADQGKINLQEKIPILKSDLVMEKLHSPIRDKNPNGGSLTVSEIIRYAVAESDGTASDVLLRIIGGAEVVDKYLRTLNVNGVVVMSTEKEISSDVTVQYKNWADPISAVKLLKVLFTGNALSAKNQALLLNFMTETETGKKRLKGLLPAGTIVAHKTGTSLTTNGLTHATNDIGIITLPNGKHLAMAVFVSDSTASQDVREGVIAKLAQAAWNYWMVK